MSDADRVAVRYQKEGTFGTTPNADLAAKTTVSVDQTDNSYNDAVEDLSVFAAGQQILVSGFTDTNNNGYKNVVSATANKMIVRETLVTEALGDTVSILSAMKEIRFTGESLKQETDTTPTNEIRDDRQIGETKRTSVRGSGGIEGELSYGVYDDFIESSLQSAAWSTAVTDTQTTFSMANGDNSINDSGSGFVAAGFTADQWIRTSGFTEDENNAYFKIVSVAAGKMVLKGGSGGAVATEAAGDTVTILMGPQITNGTTKQSYSIEKEFTDNTTDFEIDKGFYPNEFTLTTEAESLINVSFGYMGKNSASASATANTGRAKTAPTNPVFSSVDDVTAVLENLTSTGVISLDFTINNKMRNRAIVGTLGPNSMGSGSVDITGTLQAYYSNSTMIDKYLNFTDSNLALVLEDGDGNGYVIDFPKINFTDGERLAGGTNTDVVVNLPFSATRYATEDVTVRIARFDA